MTIDQGLQTLWILLGEVGVLGRDTDGLEGLRRLRHSTTQGIGAVDITRSDRTLTLVFGTGHRFVLLPNKPHRSKDDLDLWELFSPTAGGWRSAATARST
jgi:hypothetical protein